MDTPTKSYHSPLLMERGEGVRRMLRCLSLAKNGRQNARPNPMVGAVIVSAEGDIIGEGYHVRCGEAHAEVNAFADCDRRGNNHLLPGATIYVSLEPCAHYGKTPPCADLIIRKGVRRCVVGCVDTFSEVSGRGIQKLRDAGVEVVVGMCEEECKELNRAFFTYHNLHRPFITLKWAQSADGFIDKDFQPVRISNDKTLMLAHKLRAESDAILVGRTTMLRDKPSLTVRHWYGRDPRRCVLTHDEGFAEECRGKGFLAGDWPSLLASLPAAQTLLVEGGAAVHRFFLDHGLWDVLHIETSPQLLHSGTRAAAIPPSARLVEEKRYDGNVIRIYRNL